jgi:SAM-dependent methyltransferase/formate-dependent phosphoribosylglycinamide formyltransferase (GAR transformylase)
LNAPLKLGDVVLDLGSGAGFDSLLAAGKVGSAGRIIGVDFVPEMIERSITNAAACACENVEYRLGDIEALPVESESIDIVTSNCVLNLVPDKVAAFREIERVLRPGGCFVTSDTVLLSKLPAGSASSPQLYACCVSGAIPKADLIHLLEQTGLIDVEILSERDVTHLFAQPAADDRPISIGDRIPRAGLVASVTVRAFKPNANESQPAARTRRPALIVLGLSDRILPLSQEFGVEPIFLGPRPDRAPAGARFYQVDVNDPQAIWDVADQLRGRADIAGVLTVEGYFLCAATELASRLELPAGLSMTAALCGENKLRARQLLQQAGIKGPRFSVASSLDRAVVAACEIGWPIVAKPLNDSNSRLVALCSDEDSLTAAVAAILGAKTNLVGQKLVPAALLESFIDGPEYSAEVATDNGCARTLAICEKTVGPAPYFVEIGHVVPARLSPDLERSIRSTAEAAVVALGARNCVAHVELRLRGTDVFIIEVNLRPAGGQLPELIATVTGCDLHGAAMKLAMGRPLDQTGVPRASVGIYHCFTVDEPSRVFYSKNPIELNCDEPAPFVEMDVQPGAVVYPVNHPEGRIFGRVLAYGETVSSASLIIDDVKSALNVRIERFDGPDECNSGDPGCWTKGCC